MRFVRKKTASVLYSALLSFALCEDTEAGCSCVFGLLLDKRGAMTNDNEITVAPLTSAYTPEKGRRRSCKIFKDVC